MELRHLRYFATIAEERSFRRASERLHTSQSPLSRQMRDLQDEIGVELFEPDGRGVKLTQAGTAFADRARAILASVVAAVDEARGIAEGRLGTVAIGFETGTTFMGLFLALVAALRRRLPTVKLQLFPMSSVEQADALRSGAIACGYGAHGVDDKGIAHMAMSRDRLGLLVAAHHPLARRKRVRLEDLENERLVLQPRQQYPALHAGITAAARARGISMSVAAEIADLEALLALVVIGDVVTLCSEKFGEQASYVSLRWIIVDGLNAHLSEFVAWRAADESSPIVKALIESAREVSSIAPARSVPARSRGRKPR